jgi:multidrug efflux pump
MYAMDRLSQRFPPGLKYEAVYDTTTFVHATTHDVLITLVIAFALVVARPQRAPPGGRPCLPRSR